MSGVKTESHYPQTSIQFPGLYRQILYWQHLCKLPLIRPYIRITLLQLTDVANCFWVAPPRPRLTSPERFSSVSARQGPDCGDRTCSHAIFLTVFVLCSKCHSLSIICGLVQKSFTRISQSTQSEEKASRVLGVVSWVKITDHLVTSYPRCSLPSLCAGPPSSSWTWSRWPVASPALPRPSWVSSLSTHYTLINIYQCRQIAF